MWFQLALFYSERELGLAYSLVSTASSLSGVLGGPLAAAILKLDGVFGLHGWQVCPTLWPPTHICCAQCKETCPISRFATKTMELPGCVCALP